MHIMRDWMCADNHMQFPTRAIHARQLLELVHNSGFILLEKCKYLFKLCFPRCKAICISLMWSELSTFSHMGDTTAKKHMSLLLVSKILCHIQLPIIKNPPEKVSITMWWPLTALQSTSKYRACVSDRFVSSWLLFWGPLFRLEAMVCNNHIRQLSQG